MATYLDRVGRVKDILLFLHREKMASDSWSSVGDYARFAGISKSPHLKQMFGQLWREGIIRKEEVDYRATIMHLYQIDYANVSKLYPHIRQILMEIGWQEELGL